MDFSLPGAHVRERRRAAAVTRRLQRNPEGVTTRNYHRNRRLLDTAFVVLCVLGVALGAVRIVA
jgi:hypothetical protein